MTEKELLTVLARPLRQVSLKPEVKPSMIPRSKNSQYLAVSLIAFSAPAISTTSVISAGISSGSSY